MITRLSSQDAKQVEPLHDVSEAEKAASESVVDLGAWVSDFQDRLAPYSVTDVGPARFVAGTCHCYDL